MLCNIKPVPFHESDKHIFAKIPGGSGPPVPPSGSAHAHTCMNQSSPICVLYLSDASNNKENGRMKIENFDDHTHFFCSTNFFATLTKTKNPSLQRQLHFLSTKTK